MLSEAERQKRRDYHREWARKHPGYYGSVHREWRQKNREQFNANHAFVKLKKQHNIQPLPCAVCQHSQTEAHHIDYARRFFVLWLCKIHHEQIHTGVVVLARFIQFAVDYSYLLRKTSGNLNRNLGVFVSGAHA